MVPGSTLAAEPADRGRAAGGRLVDRDVRLGVLGPGLVGAGRPDPERRGEPAAFGQVGDQHPPALLGERERQRADEHRAVADAVDADHRQRRLRVLAPGDPGAQVPDGELHLRPLPLGTAQVRRERQDRHGDGRRRVSPTRAPIAPAMSCRCHSRSEISARTTTNPMPRNKPANSPVPALITSARLADLGTGAAWSSTRLLLIREAVTSWSRICCSM